MLLQEVIDIVFPTYKSVFTVVSISKQAILQIFRSVFSMWTKLWRYLTGSSSLLEFDSATLKASTPNVSQNVSK
jgi:hypothetical protein